MVLDINSELYPVKKNELYRMVLSQTLALDGSATGSYPEVSSSFTCFLVYKLFFSTSESVGQA